MALSPSSASSSQLKRASSEVDTAVQAAATCVVDGCTADLSSCRKYHQRHKVCEVHSKSPEVSIDNQKRRFCQQCSRFHPLDEFDEGKRSCRKRLDGHNRRRRKPRLSHGTTGVVQTSGPQVHTAMAAASSLWGHSDHARSLLSSSEASRTNLNHVVHTDTPSGSLSATAANRLDSGLSYGGLDEDPVSCYWQY